MKHVDVIAGRLIELKNERDPRRKQKLANSLAAQIVRTADRRKAQAPKPRVVEETPTRARKWINLSELRALRKA